MCSKHVEAWNKLIIKFSASNWLILRNKYALTGRIFMKCDYICLCFEICRKKIKFHQDLTRTVDTLHEDASTCTVTLRWVLRGVRNIADKSRGENHNTCFIFNDPFFRKFQLMWGNVEKYGRDRQATRDNIAPRMRFAWWITNAINTYS